MALGIELDKMARDDLLRRINLDYKWAKQNRDSRTGDWRNWRKQYESEWVELTKAEDDEDLDQWFYVPLTYKTIHRMECAVRGHFFPAGLRKLAKVTPTVASENLATATSVADKVLHAKMDIEMSVEAASMDAVNAGLVEQSGVVKTEWMSTRGPDGRPLNYGSVKYVPNEHVCWDPHALCDADIRFFVQEVWKTEEELWALQEQGLYEGVQDIAGNYSDDSPNDDWYQNVSAPGNRAHRRYKLIEYWGPQQLVPDDELDKMHKRGEHRPMQDIVAVCHKRMALLRLDQNTYADLLTNPTPYEKLPFQKGAGLPRRGDTYAYSMAGLLWPIQLEQNLLRNQRRQAVDMEMTGKGVYDRTRGFNLKELIRARYGGLVGVDGPPAGAIEWFVPRTSTGQMAQEEMIVEADARQVSGVMESHMGQTPSGADTATGISIITQEGNVLLDNVIQNFAQTLFVPMARFYLACAIRWMSDEEVQEIIGSHQPFLPLAEALRSDYHVEVEAGASATSRGVQLSNYQAAIQALGQIVNAMPGPAIAGMDAIMPDYLKTLGAANATAAYLQARKAELGEGEGESPAGQQVPGMSNMANDQRMAMQGRAPSHREMRALPGRV